jgi:NAD(P)-dependent dehydrogenase (short-subunit alcohol dehydrogenase family)
MKKEKRLMEKELTGKVALVTGGSRGIGAGIALALGNKGAKVAVNYNKQIEKADKVVADIYELGGEAFAVQADVSRPIEIDRMFDKITENYGGVDILVNNAGIHQHLPCYTLGVDDWKRIIDVNLNGAFIVARKVINHMKLIRWGRIINISSISGFAGTTVECHYAASKLGIVGLTKAFALELAPYGITVNAIAPGAIDTDMLAVNTEERRKEIISRIPVGRIGLPEDIAHGVLFLASPKASFITGQTLHMNGGEGLY